MIPQFVLRELQLVADSADSLKRNRGRRGLDILQRIQKMPQLNVQILEDDFPNVREVDMKLIELAKVYDCKIVTNDFNLNKVAQLHGVEVLNINELANALKPIVLPGETMRVFILKEGKEYNQGVAYLDDGTMVVVDNAKKMISKTIDISVTSVLQTTAGKMIFGRFDDRVHAVHDKSRSRGTRTIERRASSAPQRAQPAEARGFRYRSCTARFIRMKVSVILPAAGLGTRMGRAVAEKAGTSRKQFMLLEGSPILLHTIRKFVSFPPVTEIVVALRAEDMDWVRELLDAGELSTSRCAWSKAAIAASNRSRMRWPRSAAGYRTGGGARRRAAVHRSSRRSNKVFAEAAETGAAIVGIVPVDTVKQVHRNKIRATIPREQLMLAQTPQVFRFDLLKRAFDKAREDGFTGTDESSLVERWTGGSQRGAGQRSQYQDHQADRHGSGAAVPGRGTGGPGRVLSEFRIGQGWDVHRIVAGPAADPGRRHHPSEFGLEGHSDADVLPHAITDALLGAAALGDIGMHFPGYRSALEGRRQPASSCGMPAIWSTEQGFRIVNVDSTVILERPS